MYAREWRHVDGGHVRHDLVRHIRERPGLAHAYDDAPRPGPPAIVDLLHLGRPLADSLDVPADVAVDDVLGRIVEEDARPFAPSMIAIMERGVHSFSGAATSSPETILSAWTPLRLGCLGGREVVHRAGGVVGAPRHDLAKSKRMVELGLGVLVVQPGEDLLRPDEDLDEEPATGAVEQLEVVGSMRPRSREGFGRRSSDDDAGVADDVGPADWRGDRRLPLTAGPRRSGSCPKRRGSRRGARRGGCRRSGRHGVRKRAMEQTKTYGPCRWAEGVHASAAGFTKGFLACR